MNDNNKKWLAAYLYYSEPWHKLLVDGIKPFIEYVVKNNLAEQFFFIRYWEKGPHIRLRFKGDPQVLEEKLKPKLLEHFNSYFEQQPSSMETPDWVKDLPSDQQWYPNNSIQFIDYEPEVDRYGGDTCILIAEEQFCYSSKVTLDILDEGDEWDYSRALGAAIQLHLGFAHAMGMDINEAQGFFERLFQNWLSRAYYSYEEQNSIEELEKRKQEVLDAFEQNLNNQKEVLQPFFQEVWDAFQHQQEFEQSWLNDWIEGMKAVKTKLQAAQNENRLSPPDWYKIDVKNQIAPSNQQRWAIYDSYIHMVNNRLGVLNRDESYLGYLIKETLKSLKSEADV